MWSSRAHQPKSLHHKWNIYFIFPITVNISEHQRFAQFDSAKCSWGGELHKENTFNLMNASLRYILAELWTLRKIYGIINKVKEEADGNEHIRGNSWQLMSSISLRHSRRNELVAFRRWRNNKCSIEWIKKALIISST